jgi:hypothetical protein
MMICSKQDFDAYEALREQGSINVLDVKQGTMLTGLSEEKYVNIIKNYKQYKEQYYGNKQGHSNS